MDVGVVGTGGNVGRVIFGKKNGLWGNMIEMHSRGGVGSRGKGMMGKGRGNLWGVSFGGVIKETVTTEWSVIGTVWDGGIRG